MADRSVRLAAMRLGPAQRDELRQIATELAKIARTGDVLPGSILERLTRCGRPGCACQKDPPRRHGPYWQWTRKVQNKTVSKYLNKQQAQECRRWVDNDRRIRELVARLEAIGIARLEADQQRD
jgi:hypothetical protein